MDLVLSIALLVAGGFEKGKLAASYCLQRSCSLVLILFLPSCGGFEAWPWLRSARRLARPRWQGSG